MTAPSLAIADAVENLPLARGSAVRAEAGVIGLPKACKDHEAEFRALVSLLAHRESQGFTHLGFNDTDSVVFHQADDADSHDESGEGGDEPREFNGYLGHWNLVTAVAVAAAAESSAYLVDANGNLPNQAEFAIDQNRKRLMFARAADNEARLWREVRARAAADSPLPPATIDLIERLFPAAKAGTPAARGRQEQINAVNLMVSRRFSMVSGSPGTGKTYALVRAALAWLCGELASASATPGAVPRSPRLMAPTARAAARMGELIAEALDRLVASPGASSGYPPQWPDAVRLLREAVPTTIHKVLEASPLGGWHFKRDRGHPIGAGLVIVDEASMLDLELARSLLEALPSDSNICLVGDPGQLKSVEKGSILPELMAFSQPGNPLHACHAALSVSRRFPPGSMIDRLARSINGNATGESDQSLLDMLQACRVDKARVETEFIPGGGAGVEARVRWWEVTEKELPEAGKWLARRQAEDLRAQPASADPAISLRRCVVLGVHRNGPVGAHTLARHAAETPGRPGVLRAESIIVTRNNNGLNLSNGDLGLVRRERSAARVVFPDGKSFDERALPPHSPAAALTVHKSQGSEWNSVYVVLPARWSALLQARLLYTACTRAKSMVTLVATRSMLEQMSTKI